MQRPCSHKGLSNQRTTWRGKRRSEECKSGDSHFEWPPMIMGFIHARNVCQKEVITFSRLWEEEEARLIRREEKMEAIEDQALTIQRRSFNRWGIWRSQLLKNFLIYLSIWIINDPIRNEEDDEAEDSRRSIPTKQIKISIQFSFHCFVMHLFIFS